MRFVLIHGGTMGGWCFGSLVRALEALGQEAVAPDLPGHGQRVAEKSTFKGYRDTVLAHLQHGDVLVGHSLGGYAVTAAADKAPGRIKHLIYLAGGIHHEGLTMVESLAKVRAESGATAADFSE